MDSNWEVIKQKETELLKIKVLENVIRKLKKVLENVIDRLEMIRSNRISLEAVRRVIENYQKEKKLAEIKFDLSISPSNELIVRSAKISSIVKIFSESKLGYEKKEISEDKAVFSLSLMTEKKREELTEEVKKIADEKGKKVFRLIHQDIKNTLRKEKLSEDQRRKYEAKGDELVKDYQKILIKAEEKKIREILK